MSVSTYINRTYHIPRLQPHIYIMDASKVENKLHIDYRTITLDRIVSSDVIKINGNTISLEEETSLDERYRFSKSLSISIDGYYAIENLEKKYFIVVEDYHKNQFLVNYDFPCRVTYNYTIDDNDNRTTFNFDVLSNFPLVKLNHNLSATSEQLHCRYWIGKPHKIKMIEKDYVVLNKETKEIAISNNETFKEIEPLTFNFLESFDGNDFNTNISFTIPLDDYKSYWQYSLLEFTKNRYSMIIEPLVGENNIYVGFGEFGLMANYSISTDGDNIVTILLQTNERCYANESFESYQDGQTFWIPISSVTTDRGEYMTSFECSSTDGYAKYLLLKEIDAFGHFTGNYKALEGYEEDYNHFINIIGTFDDEILFKHDDCKFKCQTISNIPNVIVFSSVASYTYTISSLCTWTIDNSNLPSGVTVSPLSGGTSITNITISCSDVGASEGNYSIVLHTQDEDIPSTISIRLSQDEEYYAEIDARRQNVDFNTIFPIEYLYGDITRIIDFNVIENYIKFDIPRNDSTEERIFNIVAEDIYGSEITFHILQHGIVQEWIEEDDEYVCVGGDLYSVATLWTGYTQSELKRTNETKPYTMSVPRSEECEQYSMWQWNGDTICIDGNLYKLLTLMVSSDGYEWRETEETMAGDLIEESSLDCAENIYEINVRTKDEVGSSIWTTIVVRINGGEPMNYTNVSACTFNVAEGAEYEILFADKPNYFKPDTITATATEDKTYDAIYTTARQYNVGVTTVDEQRNYIRSNITICMDGQCRTYQGVSAITFSAPVNTEFEVSFSDVQGYSTPQPIETSITADVDYIAVYGTPKSTYDISVSSNIACDITINGTTYSSVTATSVTLASGTSYTISFSNESGYNKPNNITGVATSDMSYSVQYTEIINTYTINVSTTDENSNPIFTRIGVAINGSVQTYPNVSALTFSVNEGDDYIITYFAKDGYTAPSVVSVDSATSNASYVGVYQRQSEKYRITINSNIECDITATINGTSTLYEDVSTLTLYLDSGDTYVIEFEDKVGYIKPNTIQGIANGNKIYNVKYTRAYTLRVISNMPCDMTINGTTYSSVTDTSVTIVSGASYSVSFGAIEGYITPSTQSGIMDSDKTITVNYEAKTYYDLVVNSNILCTMTINGNSYTNTSVTLSLESGSSYEISFSNEIGYTKPNNISGVLNDNTTYNVEYVEIIECTMLISSNMVTDVVVVINSSSTTYNDITTTSLTLTQGDTYSVSFEQKEGYHPIATSSGTMVGDLNIYAYYYSEEEILKAILTLNNNTIATISGQGELTWREYYQYKDSVTDLLLTDNCTSVEREVCSYSTNLSSLTMSDSVTSVGSNCFVGCYNLSNIVLSTSLTRIDNAVFGICTSLSSITIPNSVTSIGDSAFSQCSNLRNVILSTNIVSIESSAFSACSKLKSVVIPNSVTSIGSNAFKNCNNLSSITIPNSVTSIGYGAFEYCYRLTNITIPSSVTSIGSYAFDGCGFVKNNFKNNSSLDEVAYGYWGAFIGDYETSGLLIKDTTLVYCRRYNISANIPNNITIIGYNAFANCSSLTSVTIPNSVTNIGDKAFLNCSSLGSITSFATTAPYIASNAFDEIKTSGTLYVPSGSSGYDSWMNDLPSGWTKVEQ